MSDGYGGGLRFISAVKALKGAVDLDGQGLGIQLV
jgi:hypothetical protein